MQKKDASEYRDLFLRYKDFWENGEPTEEQVDAIYKRKPRAPYVEAHFADGSTEKVWCTFDEEQIDINCKSGTAKKFLWDNLTDLCRHGAAMIRLERSLMRRKGRHQLLLYRAGCVGTITGM